MKIKLNSKPLNIKLGGLKIKLPKQQSVPKQSMIAYKPNRIDGTSGFMKPRGVKFGK